MATDPTLQEVQSALRRAGDPTSDFDLNPRDEGAPQATLRPAAVLVALIERGAGLTVLLTKRSSALKHHPGQIAFPGGKVDAADASVEAAALREAQEEVALSPSNLEVFGQLPAHDTVTGFSVTPVVARVRAEFAPVPAPEEVEEVFEVPFSHLCNPNNFSVQSRRWRGRTRSFYAVPYGPYYIWGATARILRGLADRL